MLSNLIFSYNGQFVILPGPAVAISDLGGMAGELADKD